MIVKKKCYFILPFEITKKPTSFCRPFTSYFAEKMSPLTLMKIYLVFNKLDPGTVCIFEGMHQKNITIRMMFGCVEPINDNDVFFCLKKHTKTSSKFDSLSFKMSS